MHLATIAHGGRPESAAADSGANLVDEWLQPYREMWASSLDDLERHLDTMTDRDEQ